MLVADAASEYAAVAIALDAPAFLAGDVLHGSVVVVAKQRIACSAMGVVVLGAEKVNWNFSRGPSIFRKRDEVCFSHQVSLCASTKTLASGSPHTFRFECALPSGLPGSFDLAPHITPTSRIKYTAASIEYTVQVAVDLTAFSNSSSSQAAESATESTTSADATAALRRSRPLTVRVREVVTIHENPVGQLSAAVPREDVYLHVPVHVWTCCHRTGSYDLRVSVTRDACVLGDELVVLCDVTNNCRSVAVDVLTCRLVQVVTMQLRTIEHSVEKEICEWKLTVDVLPRAHVVRSLPIKAAYPEGSPYKLVPSTRNGKVVRCSYVLQVEAVAQGSINVVLRLPVTLLSPVGSSSSIGSTTATTGSTVAVDTGS